MARATDDLEPDGAEFDLVPLIQPLIRGEGRDRGEAEAGALAGQGLQQKGILTMRTYNGQIEVFRQQARGPHMVEMTMSQKNFFQGDIRLPDQDAQPLQVSAGIDDDRPLRLITPEKGAVLLEGRDR